MRSSLAGQPRGPHGRVPDQRLVRGPYHGWDVQRESGQSSRVVDVTTLDGYMVGSEGEHVFHSYSSSGAGSATLSQEATGLREGYYRLSAWLATDGGGSVVLFAGDSTAVMTDDGFGKRYMRETVIDSILVTDGTLAVGVKGNDDWYKADNFRLFYLGSDDATPVLSVHQAAPAVRASGTLWRHRPRRAVRRIAPRHHLRHRRTRRAPGHRLRPHPRRRTPQRVIHRGAAESRRPLSGTRSDSISFKASRPGNGSFPACFRFPARTYPSRLPLAFEARRPPPSPPVALREAPGRRAQFRIVLCGKYSSTCRKVR